jgi:hypothetical protein
MSEELEVTVLLPCLNEVETLETCIHKALRSLADLGIRGEVLVSDNGSTDGSQRIAEQAGARVIHAPICGYGGALMAGIDNARGSYIVMADADDSYDLTDLGPFIEQLRAGRDLVMGNRFRGGIQPGAMPFLHRYLGNPVLSHIGRLLFGLRNVGDFHCGVRGFHRGRILELGLCMPGMEFASELIVRAALAGYDIAEVPTTLSPDGRSRRPHLRTWRDGWRHLRFLLVFAPRKALVWPGLLIGGLGLLGGAVLTVGPVRISRVELDIDALAYCCLAVLVGTQLILFGGHAELYGSREGIVTGQRLARWEKWLRLETCAAAGMLLIAGGLAGTAAAVGMWSSHDFGPLDPRDTIRLVLPSATAIALGVLVLFSGLLGSLLSLRTTVAASENHSYERLEFADPLPSQGRGSRP